MVSAAMKYTRSAAETAGGKRSAAARQSTWPRRASSALRMAIVAIDDLSRAGIEDQRAMLAPVREVEHPFDRASQAVERRLPFRRRGGAVDQSGAPVVLDEAEDGSLVGDVVVDVVRLRPGRDDQERQAGAVA